MYDRILVPTDGSETVEAVLDAALDLAARSEATVHLLSVADTSRFSTTMTTAGVEDVLEAHAERVVAEAAERVRGRDLEAVTAVEQGRPARVIVDYADRVGADLVVMPTHGRTGVARLFLGSVTERVVRASEVPVLAIRPEATVSLPADTILVPTDGSAPSAAALDTAIDLALEHDAGIALLHVIDTVDLGPDVGSYLDIDRLEGYAESILTEAADTARTAGVDPVTTRVEYGTPHREIRRAVADVGADLVVMGTQGLTGIDRYLLGSVTETVLRSAPVPVLTVHGPGTE